MYPPQISDEFLRFAINFEYFKRNSVRDAHLNVCRMIDAAEFNDRRLPDLKPDELEVDDDPPLKRKRYGGEVNLMEEEDQGSDDSYMEGYRNEFDDVCSMKKIKMTYEELATNELKEYSKKGRKVSGEEILRVLSIREIAKSPIFDSIRRPIRVVEATVGYRKVTIKFCSDATIPITFMSSQQKCLIWYGNTLAVGKNSKYQSLAAKTLFYLVKHRDTKLDELEFDVEDYRKWDPPNWPFKLFYSKVGKHLRETSNLHVKNFVMKLFYDQGRTENGRAILETVWSRLKYTQLESVTLKVWDAGEVCAKWRIDEFDGEELLTMFHHSHQWRALKRLNILDRLILVEGWNFEYFLTLETLSYQLDTYQFQLLLMLFYQMPGPGDRTLTFIVDETFEFLEAEELLTRMSQNHDEQDELVFWKGVLINGVEVTLDEDSYKVIFSKF
ncbi:unnamed protein product [Caenorhabditis brenneri]